MFLSQLVTKAVYRACRCVVIVCTPHKLVCAVQPLIRAPSVHIALYRGAVSHRDGRAVHFFFFVIETRQSLSDVDARTQTFHIHHLRYTFVNITSYWMVHISPIVTRWVRLRNFTVVFHLFTPMQSPPFLKSVPFFSHQFCSVRYL